MPIASILELLHVCANLFWVGSIVAVGVILGNSAISVVDRGRIALTVYQRVASPAFGLSFIMGVTMLLLEPRYYFVQTHMMHAKLPLAIGVIVLHHWLGSRSKTMAAGATAAPGYLPVILLVAGAAGSAALAILKPF